MNIPHSDALVFFGATGDLAYKKIFPSLQAMIKRGHLNVPVIGVAKAGWNVDQLRGAGTRQPEKHGGGVDPAALTSSAACCVMSTAITTTQQPFRPSARSWAQRERPAHYLAIPPRCSAPSWNSSARPVAPMALVSSLKSPSVTTCLGAGPQSDSARALLTRSTSFASIIILGKRASA